MMTSEEQAFLLSHVNVQSVVLEFGSGASSFELARQARNIVSIEHNIDWYEMGARRKELWPYLNLHLVFQPVTVEMEDGMSDGTETEFYDYIQAGWDYGPYNLVLVDGRARVGCVRHIVQNYHHYSHPMLGEMKFFVHDCVGDPSVIQDREKDDKLECRTNEVYKYLTKVDSVGSLVQFKLEGYKT